MPEAYIVDAVRTAGGRRDGALKDWHPVDLGAAVLNARVERTRIDPAASDDVIAGCVSPSGEQSCATVACGSRSSPRGPTACTSTRRSPCCAARE